jgi:3-phosphoshikimate 1-carboxyvinyltransferase
VQATIEPSAISGIILAPAGKSSMQRACAAALLHEGETIIVNAGKSNDDLAALEVIGNLNAQISNTADGNLLIHSKFMEISLQHEGANIKINCGESGLGIRMFAPLAALTSNEITIDGTGSLLSRPMNFFDSVFPALNVAVHSNNGKLPIKIKGPLQPVDITIDGSLSSQFLTGLLFAFGKAVNKPVTISVTNLKSKPYIDLTLAVMKDFGYQVINENYERFIVNPTINEHKTITYTVEGDWSGAAFLLVAGAISGNITVLGLDVLSTQADKAIMQALMDCGASINIEEKRIQIGPASTATKPFHFNATDCPDLFPPLVALAAYCNGISVIKGVGRLAHKESNRALSLQQEFAKMGVEISLQDDLMLINGGGKINGAIVHSHHDHRIAMACAVAALNAEGETVISDAEAINKSYPDFYAHLIKLGASVTLT